MLGNWKQTFAASSNYSLAVVQNAECKTKSAKYWIQNFVFENAKYRKCDTDFKESMNTEYRILNKEYWIQKVYSN